MPAENNSVRVEYHRLATDIPVRYKFLSKSIDLPVDQVFEGTTCKLGGGGCLLVGKLPSLNWIPALLMGKIMIGANLLLPSASDVIKVLCRVAWIESIAEGSDRCSLGVQFADIAKESQDEIMKYLIRTQMTTH